MCCPSVQRQQWVTIFTCAVWHLSSLVMKKPSCPTLPRSSQVFHIQYRVHLLSMYFYCCYLDFFILEAQELLLECPWCMNTLFQTDQTFLRIFLVLDTMKQMKYEGVGVASACTTLPIIVLFYPGKCSLHGSGLVHLEDIVQSSVFFQRWAATASS